MLDGTCPKGWLAQQNVICVGTSGPHSTKLMSLSYFNLLRGAVFYLLTI